MSAYRPPQRSINAQILAASRWIRGTFHLPKLHSFLDYLGKDASFFRLTGVTLDPEGPEAPFFALRRSSAAVIAPECREEELKLEVVPGSMPHPVDCLLETGMVSGLLALLPNVRVSDYLMHQEGFVVLRAATFPPGSLPPSGPVDVLFVNARALVGVRERNPSTQAAERDRPAEVPADGSVQAAPDTQPPPERPAPSEGIPQTDRYPLPVERKQIELEPVVEEWVVASRRG